MPLPPGREHRNIHAAAKHLATGFAEKVEIERQEA